MNRTLNPIVRISDVVLDISDIVYLRYNSEKSNIEINFRYGGNISVPDMSESDFKNLFTKMKNFSESTMTQQVMIVEDN